MTTRRDRSINFNWIMSKPHADLDAYCFSVRWTGRLVPRESFEGYIGFKADLDISSERLYELYVLWCEENAEKPLTTRSFCLQMAALAPEYNLEPTNKVHAHGRQVRGYVGIYSLLP